MSDDEFFGEDIVLDEATIAVLDEQEVNFFPRPAKRRKIEHVDPLETLDLPEFLPYDIPPIPQDLDPDPDSDHARRLADLEEANSELQRQLQAALDVQRTKEGEVSILRANQQKVAKEHSNLLAELNEAKESFKTRELQLQRRMKEEIERLKTELIFKQHEETSRLLTAQTARPRDTPAPKATPAPHPKPVVPPETPTRIRRSPSKSHRVLSSPHQKKSRSLADFQNAFRDDTPVVRATPPADVTMEEPASPLVAVSPSKKSSPHKPATPRNTQMDDDDDDEMMVPQPVHEPSHNGNGQEENSRPVPVQEDDFDGLQPIDWKSELTRRILAHPVTQCLSMSKVLHALSVMQQYPFVLKSVCASLTSALAALANDASSNEILPSLLNLLAHLSCTLPGFADALLPDTSLATVLATLVHRLDSSKAGEPLAKELLVLVESLSWTMSDDVGERLSPLLDSPVLLALLSPAHPTWLLENATRALLSCSTHRSLIPVFLPISTSASQIPESGPPPKIPYLECMCLILIDTNRVDSCSEATKTNILKHIATLSICHPDALPVLTSSAILLASLVTYIGWLCSGLWEDSPELIDNPSLTSERIQTLSQAVFLLYHFIFSNTPVVDIRRKLLSAPPRPFTCTHHVFIVSFGRLSFADAPIWISNEDKIVLEGISVIARDLLDLVMDGPEQDSVWDAYQEDIDEGQMDIDEMDDMEGS